jgi:subtilisin family serine protease
VSSGGCSDANKNILTSTAGYKYLLTYNPLVPREYDAAYPESLLPAISIFLNLEDSKAFLVGYGQYPLKYSLSFSDQSYMAESPGNLAGGLMSNFSSFGPTADFTLNPQLSAPGEWILSTWPLENERYSIMSGTSMAAPFMADCYALVKSQHQSLTVSMFTKILKYSRLLYSTQVE